MIPGDEALLQCPQCGGDFVFSELATDASGAVREGVLCCGKCTARFPVVNYVAVLMNKDEAMASFGNEVWELVQEFYECASVDAGFSGNEKHRSGINWGYQFGEAFPVSKDVFDNADGFWGEKAFYEFCGLDRAELDGCRVCTFCGGSGREAWHLCRSGASNILVVDIGDHLFQLPEILREYLTKLVLVRADVYRSGLRDGVLDIGICDHALQHVPNQWMAYSVMASKVKSGGKMSVCVYSHENNFVMTGLVEPMKVLFHRLPLRQLRCLAFFPAMVLYLLYVVIYSLYAALAGDDAADRLPYYALFRLWAKDGFRKFWEACFDLMQAPVSYHFTRREVEELAVEANAEIINLSMVNKTMWSMVARLP